MGTLREAGLQPDAVSYATLLYAASWAGDVPRALSWLETMKEEGVHPNRVVFNTVLRTCGIAGDVATADRMLAEMADSGVQLDDASYFGLLQAMSRSTLLICCESPSDMLCKWSIGCRPVPLPAILGVRWRSLRA